MPELVVQEPDDGVGQALLVIHLETGRDHAPGFLGSADPSRGREEHRWGARVLLRQCPWHLLLQAPPGPLGPGSPGLHQPWPQGSHFKHPSQFYLKHK